MGFLFDELLLETRLVKGDTKEIRKEKRRLKEFKAKKRLLEIKRENDGKIQKIKCEIKQLECEINNNLKVCEKCGQKSSMDSCYCPKCGGKL